MSDTTRRDAMLGAAGVVAIPPADGAASQNAKLMMGFCSLGRNCEFGQAQRNLGAEPLDLLRWAGITHPVLINLLQSKLEGVSDPALIKIFPVGKSFMARHTKYGFDWHADGGEAPDEVMREREGKRLRFLVRKFLNDLADGSRIYVISDPLQNITESIATQVLTELNAYGSPRLVYVTNKAPVDVQQKSENLLHGTIPEFADTSIVTRTTPSFDWLAICERIRAIFPSS